MTFSSRTISRRQRKAFSCSHSLAMVAVAAVSVCLWLQAKPATASIVYTVQNSGTNLQWSWAGSWDVTAYGAISQETTTTDEVSYASSSFLDIRTQGVVSNAPSYPLTISTSWNSPFILNFVFTGGSFIGGDSFHLYYYPPSSSLRVTLPRFYTSGSFVSGTAVFSGQSVASMFGTNLNSGPVTVFNDLQGNTLSFQAVPEPAMWSMIASGAISLGALSLRKRR